MAEKNAIRERGLALSPMMARATVRADSPKTMTRRLVNPQPGNVPGLHHPIRPYRTPAGCWNWVLSATGMGCGNPFPCPYGVPGDRLYGREAWRTLSKYDSLPPRDVPKTAPIWYEADGMAPPEFGRYRHGRFMVRWMARIVREVTSIAVEHLSSISEADAMREGIEVRWITFWGGQHAGQAMERYYIPGLYEERQANDDVQMTGFDCASSAFFRLWEILHGPGSVEADPWLWVIGYGEVRQ